MIREKFVFLGLLLNALASIGYIVETLKGRVKPNRVTFFLWALAPLIAFGAEINEGVGLQSLMTFMVGFSPLLIFLASFVNKKAYWKISKLDWLYGGLSILGLVIWLITRDGNLAILFSILSDGFAAMPTVIKSYHHPETEDYRLYLLAAISAVIILLTIDDWTFAHYAFPAYILIICSIISAFILLGHHKNSKKVAVVK